MGTNKQSIATHQTEHSSFANNRENMRTRQGLGFIALLLVGACSAAPGWGVENTYEDMMKAFGTFKPPFKKIDSMIEDFGNLGDTLGDHFEKVGSQMEQQFDNMGSQFGQHMSSVGSKLGQHMNSAGSNIDRF